MLLAFNIAKFLHNILSLSVESLQISDTGFYRAFHRISGLNRNTQRSKCILKLIIQILSSFPDHTIFLPFQIKHRNGKHKKQHPFTFVKKIICHYAQRQCLSHIFQKFFHRKTIMIIITFLIKLFFFFPFHSSIPALSSFSTWRRDAVFTRPFPSCH